MSSSTHLSITINCSPCTSSPTTHLTHSTGTLNGLLTTFGSLGNALGPICGSIAYASFVDWPAPLDGRLVFFAGAGIIFALGCVAGRFLVDE